MKNIYLKRAAAILITVSLCFSLSLCAFASGSSDSTLFGYNARVTGEGGGNSFFGFIMWGVLFLLILITVIAAVLNYIRIKKEEKASGKDSKPRLIIKKGYKN